MAYIVKSKNTLASMQRHLQLSEHFQADYCLSENHFDLDFIIGIERVCGTGHWFCGYLASAMPCHPFHLQPSPIVAIVHIWCDVFRLFSRCPSALNEVSAWALCVMCACAPTLSQLSPVTRTWCGTVTFKDGRRGVRWRHDH